MTTRKTERPTKESRAEQRPVRKGGNLHDSQEKLTVAGKDENYHYVWVNNEGANVAKYINADYLIVEDEALHTAFGATKVSSGSAIEVNVNRRDGQSAILMRKLKEWHTEDKKAGEQKADDAMAALNREKDKDGRYGDIKVSSSK